MGIFLLFSVTQKSMGSSQSVFLMSFQGDFLAIFITGFFIEDKSKSISIAEQDAKMTPLV